MMTVVAVLWMLLSTTDLGTSSTLQPQPLDHYDLTTVCRNDTSITLDGPHQPVVIQPITVSFSVSLFGPLRSNHANVFHCTPSAAASSSSSTATTKGGLYLYTSTDLYGAKNRLENCIGWSDSRHDDCVSTSVSNPPYTDSNNSTIPTGSDPTDQTLTPSVWDSIVLWIQPSDAHDSGRAAILTIDRRDSRMTTTTTTLRILQSGNHLIVIRDTIHIVTPLNDEDDDEMESTTITTTTTFLVPDYDLISNQSTTTQLVLSINENESMDAADTLSDDPTNIQIYVNGQPMLLNLERMDSIRTTQNQRYDDDDSVKLSIPTLQLFSNHYTEDDVFLGSIYQLDIYDTILTYDEVMTLYELGVGYYYSNTTDDDDPRYPATTPYYYLDDDEVDRYTTIHDVTSKTKRPLQAKLSTTLHNATPLQLQQQVGFVVVYQTSSRYPDRVNGTVTLIQLHSYNRSNPLMQLGIEITSLPEHGVVRFVYRSGGDIPIVVSSNGTNVDQTTLARNDDDKLTGECIVQENDIFLLRGNMTSVTISYEILPEYRHYFNIPTHDGYGMKLHVIPESLSYRIVEVPMSPREIHSNGSSPLADPLIHQIIIKSSDIVTIPIYVVHVNDIPPPTILLGQHEQQQEPQLETSNQSNSTLEMIILSDYQVMIPDGINVLFTHHDSIHNLDYVRVDVITLSDGTITLHPDRLTVLSVAHQHCTQRYYSNWQCTEFLKNDGNVSDERSSGGSGSRLSHVTFVALPSDVPILLNQMLFTSHLPGQGGNVTIHIYSGTGHEDCLYPKEHYLNYITTNRVFDYTISTETNSSVAAKVVVMNYILARNDTCTRSETTLIIPNFATVHSDSSNAGHTKDEFKMFGFAWKELIFGSIIVAIFLFCFCGGCSFITGPSLPVVVRRPTATRWMLCYRLSKKQLNYNDYID